MIELDALCSGVIWRREGSRLSATVSYRPGARELRPALCRCVPFARAVLSVTFFCRMLFVPISFLDPIPLVNTFRVLQ